MRVTSSETLTLFRVKLFWSCSQSASGSCLVRSQKSLQDYCLSLSPGLFLHFCDVLPLNTTKRTDYYLNAHEVHLNVLPSGTPIQNSLKDLYMLMSFLKLKPFNVKEWWNRIIQRPVTMGDKVGLKYVNNSFIPNHPLSMHWIFLPYTVNVFSGTCKRW